MHDQVAKGGQDCGAILGTFVVKSVDASGTLLFFYPPCQSSHSWKSIFPSKMPTQLQISNLKTLRSCKLCIICAKSAEATTVKTSLFLKTKISRKDVAKLPPGSSRQDFYLGSLTLKDSDSDSLSYYVTSTSRQGI